MELGGLAEADEERRAVDRGATADVAAHEIGALRGLPCESGPARKESI